MGRFEFADGAEATPPDRVLAALKRDRINQRLIATFNYALRSLDGAQFTYDHSSSNVTLMGARVVEGSFQLRAFDEIHVDVGYGAYTRSLRAAKTSSEVRLFAVHYHDGRGVPMRLATPGGHFIGTVAAGPGALDLVLWGAGQFGRWAGQRQLAGEIAAEAGYRLAARLQPWIRVGYFRSSGDPNPNDNRRNTFFRCSPARALTPGSRLIS